MASAEKELIERILDQLAESFRGLSSEEWARVRAGKLRILFSADSKSRKSQRVATTSEANPLVSEIMDFLIATDTRDAAQKILKEPRVTKATLRAVALALDVRAASNDTKDILVRRIVESTVGSRLRSQAIQGSAQYDSA